MDKQELATAGALRPFAKGQVSWYERVGLGGVMVALVLAALTVGLATAYADDAEKHALPSIAKAVSLNGSSWNESVTSQAGGKVFYRLTATMSETVADDEKADYVLTDKPAKEVQVKKDSVKASLVDSQGNAKASLNANVQLENGVMKIALGDLKALVPNLEYGDEVRVVYEADVSKDAPAGRYQNVAKLSYDRGDGFHDTVGVMAHVNIPEQPQQASNKESMPKTGDALPDWMIFAVGGLLAVSISALAVASARRKGKEQD